MVIKDNSLHYITNSIVVNRNVNDSIDVILFADKVLDFNYTTAYLYAIKISPLAEP